MTKSTNKSSRIPNILLIEDDRDLRSVYTMILRSQGYRVETANDGMAALIKLKDFTPDLILLDYLMPRMDGKTFLQNYDAGDFPDTKIVIATNISDQHTVDELKELGAYKTIIKANLSPSELLALVEKILADS